MNIIFTFYLWCFILYYASFILTMLYTAIIEEWCCRNRFPEYYQKIRELINNCIYTRQ